MTETENNTWSMPKFEDKRQSLGYPAKYAVTGGPWENSGCVGLKKVYVTQEPLRNVI